jgi:pre-mRNA-splicing factor ISY1
MLNKWTAMREGEQQKQSSSSSFLRKSGNRQRRPHLASEVEHLADAERYRNQIVAEIAGLIGKIQNPALPEHELRDLNDSINHKMREKFHWNKRVHQLGGVDYNQIEKQRQVEQGDAQFVSAGGYRYFGAAKTLPGVREVLEEQAIQHQKQQSSSKSLASLYRDVTVDYYGWRDEEDGILLELEARADEMNGPLRKRPRPGGDEDDERRRLLVDEYLNVPSQEEIEQRLLEHKKKALLAKYGL